MDKIPNINNTCVVIVTYHPDDEFLDRIKQVLAQFNKIIIVDNGSSENCLLMLTKLTVNPKIQLVLNYENLGVATALNIGFKTAKILSNNFSWCLTLDQDTLIYSSFFHTLISSYIDCPFSSEVGIIGCNYEEWTTGKILFKDDKNNKKWAEVDNLPTSGCLTSLNMFDAVGNFRDSFFIDYVDTEFCLRVKKNGFRVIISPEVCMKHPLGYYRSSDLYRFIFSRPMVTNYPPFRHYYWTRNGICLALENVLNNPRWSIRELYYLLFRRIVTILLFEDNKMAKFKYIIKGILHFSIGKSGKL